MKIIKKNKKIIIIVIVLIALYYLYTKYGKSSRVGSDCKTMGYLSNQSGKKWVGIAKNSRTADWNLSEGDSITITGTSASLDGTYTANEVWIDADGMVGAIDIDHSYPISLNACQYQATCDEYNGDGMFFDFGTICKN
jgi:hypothetical protein